MAYQQLIPASETLYGAFLLRRVLLKEKTSALKQGILLPDDFIAEAEHFAERNTIISLVSKENKEQKEVCSRCLKAFMLDTAEKHELSEEAKILLRELFRNEEMGHNGYYLDKEEVRPCSDSINQP